MSDVVTWPGSSSCPCGGSYAPRLVEVRVPAQDGLEPVVLPNVRQAACPECGSRVYTASDLERIESIFKADPRSGRTRS